MVEVTPSILDRLSLNSDTDSFDAYKEILRLTTALAAKEAELAASRRVIYLLQWSAARFHDAIRAIQRDCSPEIAARIDEAFADNKTPPEAVGPELAAERAKVEKLREALALYAVDQDCDLCERTVSYGDAARAALTETQP